MEEVRAIIDNQLPCTLSKVQGTQKFLEIKSRSEGASPNGSIHWVLRAQIGSIEKISSLFREIQSPSSMDALALARYLFENLVWLRLFLVDHSWGLFFYGQFLKNQRDDVSGLIEKLTAEAEMFEKFDKEDSKIIDDILKKSGDSEEFSEAKISGISIEIRSRKEELDRRARRTFALGAAAATFNGYGYQAHLLRTKNLPMLQQNLDLVEGHIDAFKNELKNEDLAKKYLGRWNWRGEADRVNMADQYDFLYRLTSRLLHATPMSIITEKQLLENEFILLMEYVVVSLQDVVTAISEFEFPGKISAVCINTD